MTRQRPAFNLEGRPWYSIRNEKTPTSSKAKVYLYDAIGGWFGVTATDFVRELNDLDVDEIELHINSPGGSVYDGIAIRNALVQHDATITAIVDGLAASAASYIALAGDEVVMAPNSELMIHDASGVCLGWAQDMRKMAEDLDRISDNIATMYADKAGGDAKAWRKVMLAETWYSADEAVEAGLADRVDRKNDDGDGEDVENRFDLSVFNYAGRSHAPTPKLSPAALAAHDLPTASAAGAHPPAAPASGDTTQEGVAAMDISDEQLTNLRQTAGVADDADVDTCIAALTEALQEQAEPQATPTQPEGTILVDQAAFADLQAQAALGVQAREQQMAAHREQVLNDAVRSGRIAPASRPGWAALLEKDATVEATIAELPANTIPVDEIGHAGFVESTKAEGDNALMAELFPTEA
ncbi:head maturation protease, ClpP-related [Janibacter anophelis]|uniref:head maturation protease, ClpP-related n=1 Tax=Janibacter anophelis TaxID=319054 RepID=UPI000DEFEC4A|nr:head maturation protease, ClpP-related [Janibacter anophelis]